MQQQMNAMQAQMQAQMAANHAELYGSVEQLHGSAVQLHGSVEQMHVTLRSLVEGQSNTDAKATMHHLNDRIGRYNARTHGTGALSPKRRFVPARHVATEEKLVFQPARTELPPLHILASRTTQEKLYSMSHAQLDAIMDWYRLSAARSDEQLSKAIAISTFLTCEMDA